jgi:PAB1-binding protein PBP1
VMSNLAIVAPQNSLPSLFRTDKDIANGKGLPRQRELQPWVPDESIQPSSGGIPGKRGEDTFGNASAGWDQFATNAKLFGTKSDFDEDIYTTKLNKNTANFRQREAEAERLAREIQNVNGGREDVEKRMIAVEQKLTRSL